MDMSVTEDATDNWIFQMVSIHVGLHFSYLGKIQGFASGYSCS